MISRPSDQELLREWVETWRRAGPLLREQRDREVLRLGTMDAIRALDGAFRAARSRLGLAATSGLIEQQRWLQRLRR